MSLEHTHTHHLVMDELSLSFSFGVEDTVHLFKLGTNVNSTRLLHCICLYLSMASQSANKCPLAVSPLEAASE